MAKPLGFKACEQALKLLCQMEPKSLVGAAKGEGTSQPVERRMSVSSLNSLENVEQFVELIGGHYTFEQFVGIFGADAQVHWDQAEIRTSGTVIIKTITSMMAFAASSGRPMFRSHVYKMANNGVLLDIVSLGTPNSQPPETAGMVYNCVMNSMLRCGWQRARFLKFQVARLEYCLYHELHEQVPDLVCSIVDDTPRMRVLFVQSLLAGLPGVSLKDPKLSQFRCRCLPIAEVLHQDLACYTLGREQALEQALSDAAKVSVETRIEDPGLNRSSLPSKSDVADTDKSTCKCVVS